MQKSNRSFIKELTNHLNEINTSKRTIEGVELFKKEKSKPSHFFKIKFLDQEFELRLYTHFKNKPQSSFINIWDANRPKGKNSLIQFTIDGSNFWVAGNEFTLYYNRGITIGTGQIGLRDEFDQLILENGFDADKIIVQSEFKNPDFKAITSSIFKWVRIVTSAKIELEKKYRNELSESPNEDFITDTESKTEGGEKVVISIKKERDSSLRKAAIKIHGYNCMVCNFNFKEQYGEWGEGFIEVHHVRKLAAIKTKTVETNPKTDLAVVCANCHRMIHKKTGITLTIEELKRRMGK